MLTGGKTPGTDFTDILANGSLYDARPDRRSASQILENIFHRYQGCRAEPEPAHHSADRHRFRWSGLTVTLVIPLGKR